MATEYVYNELTGEFEEREVQPPRFKYFRLRNNKAFLNTPCTIEWEVENASSVSLDRVGPQSLVGFFTFRPHELTSRWTLRAHGEGDSELTLEVKASPLPKILSFKATQRRNNETYIVGDRIVLNWNAEFYDQIRLNGNDVTGLSSAEVELTSEQNDFEIEAQCEDHISKDAVISTDGWTGYSPLKKEYPKDFNFLPGAEKILAKGKEEPYDLAISVDCTDLKRLAGGKEYFEPAKRTIQIDHHSVNSMFADFNYVDPVAPACCQVLIAMFEYYEIEITRELALWFSTLDPSLSND